MLLYSPCNGEVKRLEEVNDEVFAQKMMGDGIAIIPDDGAIYSPVAGVITMLFPTKHALGILSDDGVEIMLHVGIDTVELNGEGFTSLIKEGDRVAVGSCLLHCSLDVIRQCGYACDVMMIITNTSCYSDIHLLKSGKVQHTDIMLSVE